MMPKHKEEWVSANEGAKILSRNTDHVISPHYVRLLAKNSKITCRARNRREFEYLKSDLEAYHVRPQNTPRVKPRPSTRKPAAQANQ
jgi:hypothetical protein